MLLHDNLPKSVNRLLLVTLLVELVGSVVISMVATDFIGTVLISQLILAGPALVWFLVKRIPIRKFIRLEKLDWPTVLLVIVFAFVINPVLSFVNLVSQMIFSYNFSETMVDETKGVPFVLMLLCVAVLPAILEEIVYRGVFYQSYRKAGMLKAAILSGLLFGLMHGNFNQFMYAFLLGAVFSLLIEATGSIASTMLVHFCFNGTSVCALALLRLLEQVVPESGNLLNTEAEIGSAEVIQTLVMAVFCGVISFFVFRAIAVRNGRWEFVKSAFCRKERTQAEKEQRPKLCTPSLILGILVMLMLCVFSELVEMGIIQ